MVRMVFPPDDFSLRHLAHKFCSLLSPNYSLVLLQGGQGEGMEISAMIDPNRVGFRRESFGGELIKVWLVELCFPVAVDASRFAIPGYTFPRTIVKFTEVAGFYITHAWSV